MGINVSLLSCKIARVHCFREWQIKRQPLFDKTIHCVKIHHVAKTVTTRGPAWAKKRNGVVKDFKCTHEPFCDKLWGFLEDKTSLSCCWKSKMCFIVLIHQIAHTKATLSISVELFFILTSYCIYTYFLNDSIISYYIISYWYPTFLRSLLISIPQGIWMNHYKFHWFYPTLSQSCYKILPLMKSKTYVRRYWGLCWWRQCYCPELNKWGLTAIWL